MKILVADDNAQNRYMLEHLLRASGHECVSAANGREALDRLRAGSFDVVVSDILMPVMDGFQFCREAKADQATAAIPFVFYTATYTEPGDVEFGLQLGAAHYLIKPSEPDVILAALGNLRRGPAPAAAAPQQDEYLAQYNARLVQKLESKMLDLERANTDLLRTNLALSDEIGRRRAAEQGASASLVLQQATLESTADGILAVSDRGRILAWNRSFLELWGLPVGEAPSGTIDQLIARICGTGAESAACTEQWRQATGGTATSGATVMHLAGGRIVERLTRPMPVVDGRGGRVWTFRDVTERHRAEESRRAMQTQLFEQQKMEALGLLAGGVAHDFNNILTAILGRTTLAATMIDSAHPAQQSLADVVRAGQRAADLVRQILTFARHQEPIRQVMRLEPVVNDAMKLAGSTLPASVKLVVELGADVPTARIDPTQLHQVLLNLITNANHAMKGHGRVQVTLGALTAPGEGPIELRPGRYAVITVTDSGPGIDGSLRQKIFEPFFTTKPAGQGTGLGLAVVHGIITGFGGHVDVVNAPGAGAQFRIFLPAATGEARVGTAPPAGAIHRGKGELILVAEDDAVVRDFVCATLESIGYRCNAAASAEEAMEKFLAQPAAHAALLTDLSMPGMNGFELSRTITKIRPGLPVVIMTGYLSAQNVDLDQIGRDFDLLRKPCSIEGLSDALQLALTHRRAQK